MAKYMKQEAREYVQQEERQEMAMDKTNHMFEKTALPMYVQLKKAGNEMAELSKAMEKDLEDEMNLNPVDVMQTGMSFRHSQLGLMQRL